MSESQRIRKAVSEKALYRLGIPKRFIEIEIKDLPDESRAKADLLYLLENIEQDLSQGILIALLGPLESIRDSMAFVLSKEIRRRRYHGYCVSGLSIGQELVKYGGKLDSDRLRRLHFLTLYDMDPLLLVGEEIRAVLRVLSDFLNDKRTIILTTEALEPWRKHPVLKRVTTLLKHSGRIIDCSEGP